MAKTFLELFSELKPSRRTDRAKVLLALLCSGATPEGHFVAATALGVQLRLYLGNGSPPNIASTLRKAGHRAEVRNTEQGLEWRLTRAGVEFLAEQIEGIGEIESAGPATDDDIVQGVDVGIVCALRKPELSAVQSAFGGKNTWTRVGAIGTRVFEETRLPVMSGGDIRIVATTTTTMGLTATAIASTQLIEQFQPRLILMVGIAGGATGGGRDFGDVLVPDPSVDYTSGKYRDLPNGTRILEPDPYPIVLNAALKSLLQIYVDEKSPFDEIREGWSKSAPTPAPKIHIGPVGAADQVIDAESVIREVKRNWRKLIGVEMETYALYRAAHESRSAPLFAAFKSVCDFATNKADDMQEYAAYTAASFARYFLSRHWAEIRNLNVRS